MILTLLILAISSGVAFFFFGLTGVWVNGFGKLPEFVRWLLFLPLTLFRGMVTAGLIFLSGYLWSSLDDNLISLVAWPSFAWIVTTTLWATIPRATRVVPITFAVLFSFFAISSLFLGDKLILARILQVLACALAVIQIWNDEKEIRENNLDRSGASPD